MSARILIVLLLIGCVISGLAVVFSRHEHRKLFSTLSKLEKERDELNIEFGRLQLEQATWAESTRIDDVSRARLGMKFPEGTDTVLVHE